MSLEPARILSGAPVHRAHVASVASYAPDRVLTNLDLERMVETSDEWIASRTGIRERRLVADGEASSDMGARAASRALARAGLEPGDVNLVIAATTTPDMLFPATACLIQHKIGAHRAAAFDLGIACSGFIYGLATASAYVQSGLARNVLVVGTDCLSRFLDWTDRGTCVLFGDGAGAAVVRPAPDDEAGFLGFELGADGAGGELLMIPGGGSARPASPAVLDARQQYMQMCGNEVYKFAVRIIVDASLTVLDRCGLRACDIHWFIPHQANIRIIDAAARRLELPPERVVTNVDRYGNTSAASIPLALDEAVSDGRIQHGHRLLLVGFGAGLSWGACVLQW